MKNNNLGSYGNIFGAVLLLLISCAFTFFAVETYVRVRVDDGMQFDIEMWKYATLVKQASQDPLIGHEHRPSSHAMLMGVDFVTNSKGLRDREFNYEKSTDVKRIMMLGDSLTVGWGVKYDELFSKRLENMFAKNGEKVEIINTGVGNYNTTQEVEYFLVEGKKYNPDIIVINYFVNDAEPVPHSKQPTFIQSHCMSCVYLVGRLDAFKRRLSPSKNWESYYLDLYGNGNGSGWLDSRNKLQQLINYCRVNNIKLIITSLPELHNVQDYKFGLVTNLVSKVAEENSIQFVDLLPQLRDIDSYKLWVTVPDPHPNGLANENIALGLYKPLEEALKSLNSSQ